MSDVQYTTLGCQGLIEGVDGPEMNSMIVPSAHELEWGIYERPDATDSSQTVVDVV